MLKYFAEENAKDRAGATKTVVIVTTPYTSTKPPG